MDIKKKILEIKILKLKAKKMKLELMLLEDDIKQKSLELENDVYLVTGVEYGWIKVDNETLKEYSQAKERLSK